MKTTGHYWCERCDDAAFGEVCQQCHQDAQFVAAIEPPSATLKTPPVASRGIPADRARQLFNWVRQAIL